MWPDQVSNPGPLTYESGALPTELRDPADPSRDTFQEMSTISFQLKDKYSCIFMSQFYYATIQ